MAALPICDELRNSANSLDWEPQFILRCRREITKDLRLAREINALCARVTAIVDQREMFVDELDMLAGRHVPDKMADFMKEIQDVSRWCLWCKISVEYGNNVLYDAYFQSLFSRTLVIMASHVNRIPYDRRHTGVDRGADSNDDWRCERDLIFRIAYSKFSISTFLKYFWPVFASPNGFMSPIERMHPR
ncbi:hypothetical protein Tco_0243293 [Tanacetum coccineum]